MQSDCKPRQHHFRRKNRRKNNVKFIEQSLKIKIKIKIKNKNKIKIKIKIEIKSKIEIKRIKKKPHTTTTP